MHTRERASSIAALVMALGVTAAAHAEPAARALPIAGSAATPAGATPIMMVPAVVVPPKLPVLVNADARIPANGSLLLDTKGAHGSVIIWLEDVNETIEGTARVLDNFIIWTPNRALTPGSLYSLILEVPGTAVRNMYPVDVAPAIESSRPDLSATFRLERVDSMATSKCCSSIPGFPPRASACFPTETKIMVRLRGMLSSKAASTQLSQFMFRLKRGDDTNAVGTVGFTPLTGIQPLLWPEPESEDEFCAELAALEIGTGRVFEYDDLEMPCPSKDGLGDLSSKPIPLDAARVLSHTICVVPPSDFETEWCETNQADCGSSPKTSGCENWDHLCEGGPAPAPVPPGMGMVVPKRPMVGVAGTGAIKPERPRAQDTRDDAGFGCSLQRRGAGSGLAAFSCAVAWLLLAVRRRSTRRG